MNFDNIITSWNKGAEQLYGYRKDEVLGKHMTMLTLPEDLAAALENNRTIQQSGKVQIFDAVRIKKGNSHLNVEVMLSPIKNSHGEVIGISAISRDITERKLAEEAIKRSEDRFRTLANAVPQLIWTNDESGRANYFNHRWYEYSGLTEKESIGVGWRAIVHPDDGGAAEEEWRGALEKGRPSDYEYRLRDKDGNYRWHIGRNVPVKDSSGNIIGWFGSATEIESLKSAEESYRRLADRLQLALDAGKLGSFEYDFETKVLSATSQHKINHGFSENESPTYQEFMSRIAPDDQQVIERELGQVTEKKIFNVEYRVPLTDNSIRWIRSVGKVLYDSNGHPETLVGISLDTTEQKDFMEELSRQVDQRTIELQRSNEDLLQFAHVASHDLKEPVRKILTFNSRLVDEFDHLLPEKARMYLAKIEHATERMVSMIEGVLNYSSSKTEQHTAETVDINKTLEQIETDLELLIRKKKGTIRWSKLPKIEGVPILIYQLFYNLINNSLKFSKESEPPAINISHEVEKKGKRRFLKIIVSDNGIGFEPEFRDKIFEVFSRLNGKDEYEGTGLGLALCKKIVDRHGGEIYATGEVDKGAVFTILLPY
jgi:PAS domain S-box-containing protein